MEISQIQLKYIDTEDRMILRINLDAEQHLSLVLTRRIARFMLDSLSALLQRVIPPVVEAQQWSIEENDVVSATAEHATPAAPAAPAAPTGPPGLFHRDALPFEERPPAGNVLQLEHAAILVANAACQQTDNGLTFTFLIESIAPVNLNLSAQLAVGLSQLLTELSQRAQWFGVTTTVHRDAGEQALRDLLPAQGSVTYH